MKRILILIFLLCLIVSSPIDYIYAAKNEPNITGKSAVLIDATTGEILFEKDMHAQLYPASTTKIMTAILTLENLKLWEKVDIDDEVPFTGGSKIYLLEGEDVIVEDVLYALLLESANDAAAALGKNISDTTEEFTKLMNRRAKELGALNTNFVNAHGLHDDEHFSTAYDLAMIAKHAMKNQIFREYVQTYRHVMNATNLQETRYLYNTNRMLYDELHKVLVNGEQRVCKYEGVTGIKTGYTGQAGGCLVAGAVRGSTELIAVTLGTTDMGRFQDCMEMLDYGFENFKTVKALSKGSHQGVVKVKRGVEKELDLIFKEEVFVTLPMEASSEVLLTEIEPVDYLEAPVKAGQEAGFLRLFAGDEYIGEYPIVTAKGMEKGGWLSILGMTNEFANKIGKVTIWLFSSFIIMVASIITLRRRQRKINARKRRIKEERLRLLKEKEKEQWELNYWTRR